MKRIPLSDWQTLAYSWILRQRKILTVLLLISTPSTPPLDQISQWANFFKPPLPSPYHRIGQELMQEQAENENFSTKKV